MMRFDREKEKVGHNDMMTSGFMKPTVAFSY